MTDREGEMQATSSSRAAWRTGVLSSPRRTLARWWATSSRLRSTLMVRLLAISLDKIADYKTLTAGCHVTQKLLDCGDASTKEHVINE